MNKSKFLKWLKATVMRAIKAMAQTAIASIGTSAFMTEINWTFVFSTVGFSCLISVLMSLEKLS